MGKAAKMLGKVLLSSLNFDTRRKLNDTKIVVPIINGMKVGVSNEPWMSGILKKILPNVPGAFLDIGVNLGQTLLKVKSIDLERQVIGFEPNPSCNYYLQKLIEKNSWNNIVIVPTGLSDFDGLTKLNVSNDTDTEASIMENQRNIVGLRSKIVPVFKYTSVEQQLPNDSIGIIKIDVEGAELEVLSTLAIAIKKYRPLVFIEILPIKDETDIYKVQKRHKLISLLQDFSYRLYRIQKNSDDDYSGIAEITQLELNFHATAKDYLLIPEESLVQFGTFLSM